MLEESKEKRRMREKRTKVKRRKLHAHAEISNSATERSEKCTKY